MTTDVARPGVLNAIDLLASFTGLAPRALLDADTRLPDVSDQAAAMRVSGAALAGEFPITFATLAEQEAAGAGITFRQIDGRPIFSSPTATTAAEALQEALLAGVKDFTDADIRGLQASGLDLRGVVFNGALMDHVQLTDCHLDGCRLNDVAMRHAKLSQSSLRSAHMCQADCRETVFDGAKLDDAFMNQSRFDGASLVEASCSNVQMNSASWINADLSGAHGKGLHALGVDANLARLCRARITHSEISFLHSDGIKLDHGCFAGTSFHGTGASQIRDMLDVDITRVRFSDAGDDVEEADHLEMALLELERTRPSLAGSVYYFDGVARPEYRFAVTLCGNALHLFSSPAIGHQSLGDLHRGVPEPVFRFSPHRLAEQLGIGPQHGTYGDLGQVLVEAHSHVHRLLIAPDSPYVDQALKISSPIIRRLAASPDRQNNFRDVDLRVYVNHFDAEARYPVMLLAGARQEFAEVAAATITPIPVALQSRLEAATESAAHPAGGTLPAGLLTPLAPAPEAMRVMGTSITPLCTEAEIRAVVGQVAQLPAVRSVNSRELQQDGSAPLQAR